MVRVECFGFNVPGLGLCRVGVEGLGFTERYPLRVPFTVSFRGLGFL